MSHTWAARNIPDNRLPTSPSFFFLFSFLTTMPVNGWSRGAGIYPAASDRSITQAGGWNAPLLFLVVSAVVARCTAITFHFVTCPPRSKPAHVPASVSLSVGRTKGWMSIESESRAQLDEKRMKLKPRRRCIDL